MCPGNRTQPRNVMSRDSDHHHQNSRQPSPARAAGFVHPRPRDDTPSPSESSPERSGCPPVVKSPHTRRVLKRTRTGSPLDPITYTEPAQSPSPPVADSDVEEAARELSPLPAEPSAAREALEEELLKCLRSVYPLLEELDALLEPEVAFPHFLLHHTHRIFVRVHGDDAVSPAPAPAPAPIVATYASVAASHVTADPQSAPLPGTKSTRPDRPSAPRKAPPPTKASKQHKATRPTHRQSRHSPHRLILRWISGPPAISDRPSVTALAAVLNDATFEHHCPPHIQGVNWTGNGNLVLHTRAPYTASIHGAAVIEVVRRECGQFLGAAVLEADAPWVQVVIHGVPAKPLVGSLEFAQEGFWSALESTGNGPTEVKAIRVLCRDADLETREKLSVRLTFSDASAAKRMLSSGAFFFGTHCCASRYRPRPS
ncbi:hypothetical protein DFH09DRAFT_1086242 [Mycena vulgaris]|nr:hypothetical protein DFH09DRAFT_1086242 [Mycena vulgaris]